MTKHLAIEAYQYPPNLDDWWTCPLCNLKPKVWEFDNGRRTACGCGKNEYDHFSIFAEDIMSVIRSSPSGTSAAAYDPDELRKNWNAWCQARRVL